MKKLVLLLLIFAAASATVPSLRERVEPRVVPVWDSGLRRLDPVIQWALTPMHRWAAEHEARAIARMVRMHATSSRQFPRPGEFPAYLRREWRGARRGLDPWGTPYFLIVDPDSITVGSAGRDKERGTEDDVLATIPRR
ncbi:MAG TPA: hypothetical protein VF158_11200 [Longimicrobiales bacterium]